MYAGIILVLVVLIVWVFMTQKESLTQKETFIISPGFGINLACKDMSPECSKLAAENECESNPVRMLWLCARSCGTCGMSDSAKSALRDENLSICKDFRPNCPRLTKMECSEPSIRLRCRKTCGTCSSK